LESKHGVEARRGAEQIIDWFRKSGFEVKMTQSQDAMSAQVLRSDGKTAYPFFVRRSTGRLETSLQYLADVPAFRDDDARRKLLERIRDLPASTLSASEKLTGWPSVSLGELPKPELWGAFTELASAVKREVQHVS
jgi:hypothetical protein